jgi:hypothetical protein
VKDAVIAFEQWLRGEAHQEVEPERRQWIVDQINNGSLKGKPIVYYTNTVPDNSYGVTEYNAQTAPNHAHILQKLINEGNIQNQTKTKFSTSSETSYPGRTKENITWSDITLAFATDFDTAGEKLTRRIGIEQGKYIDIYLFDDREWSDADFERLVHNTVADMDNDQSYTHRGKVLPKKNIKLNIAGNGIYSYKTKTQEQLNDVITKYLQALIDKGVTISEIHSGGQTGIDEAGIIAAQRLGIPNEVHANKNYTFRVSEQIYKNKYESLNVNAKRNSDGTWDISDE